jgi:hypothetical protein
LGLWSDALMSFQVDGVSGSPVDAMRINRSGDVGIGKTNPGYKLDVNGESNAATYYQNGVELYAQRRWEVDLTGQNNTNFYPVELKHPYYEGSPDLPDMFPVHFKVFGESLTGSDSYNENTLVGYARGGGWSDHRSMYDVHCTRHTGSETRFEGVYEGTQNYNEGIVIYMRGGYRYSVLTDATEVNTYTSAQTLIGSVFAIKNVAGTDVSGTSANIVRLVHIAGTDDTEKRFISGNLHVNGYIKQSNLPAFYAYINTTSSSVSGIFPFNATVFNNGSHFSTSTHRFTAPVAGYYIFTGTVGDNESNEFSGKIISFYKDGAVFRDIIEGETGHASHFETTASTVVYLAKDSKFDIRMRSGSVTLNNGSDGPGYRCSFSGALIG